MQRNQAQMQTAERAFQRLHILVSARQRTGRLASTSSVPRDSVEENHARELAASACAMRARGYDVHLVQPDDNGPLVQVNITGPHPFTWQDDDLRELISECPVYVKLADYALAVHEQFKH